jgi:mono/diheme cytochrome c family protein/rhodanese-related sulfurtransferase
MCHGSAGEGYVADDANQLANDNFLSAATDDFLYDSIDKGRPGTPMAAWGVEWGGVLGRSEMRHIVEYMRTWQTGLSLNLGAAAVVGDEEAGAVVYAQHCAGCHGAQGEGVTALSLNHPWFLAQANDAFIRYAIAEGRPGTSMPGFEGQLPSSDIDNLVALIRSWQTPPPDPPPPFEADLDDHWINPGGPQPDFSLIDGRFVPADDVHNAIVAGQKMVILDARPGGDYIISHIAGATSVPFYRIADAVDHLPRDAWIITYCGCPHALSGRALDELRAAGFTQTAVLDEGFYVWRDRGYPVARGRTRYAP